MKTINKVSGKHSYRCSPFALLALFFLITFNLKGQENILLKAVIMNYGSICDFNDDNIRWPVNYTIGAGTSYTMQGCRDLENNFGHPPAIKIIIENNGNKEAEIPINGLDDVKIKTNNTTSSSIAFRKRDINNTGFGGKFTTAFCPKFTGKMTIILNPGEIIDLVFLFSEAKVGDNVNIGEKSIKIE